MQFQKERSEHLANMVYRNVDNITLSMDVYYPDHWNKEQKRTGIILFFGGGWASGEPKQFQQFAELFSQKGFVVFTPEYRIKSKHNTTPFESVADGKAAVAWIRKNAKDFGIDPLKIVAGGGSAGGHVALSTIIVEGYIDESEKDSAMPNAFVLINPVVDTTKTGYGESLIGTRAHELSPVHHLNSNVPPTIIFHGSADTTVPVENVQRFAKEMRRMGNQCILHVYEGEKHGLVSRASETDGKILFTDMIEKIDLFLQSQGF